MRNTDLYGVGGWLLLLSLILIVLFPASMLFDLILGWYRGMNGYFDLLEGYRNFYIADTPLKIYLIFLSILAGWFIINRQLSGLAIAKVFLISNVIIRFLNLVMPTLFAIQADMKRILEIDAAIHLTIAIATCAIIYAYLLISKRVKYTVTL